MAGRGDRLTSRRSLLALPIEGHGLKLPVLLQQDFDFTLGLFEFFATRRRKLHPFLKKGERLLQRGIAFLQFLNNFLQALEAFLKFCQGVTPERILIQFHTLELRKISCYHCLPRAV